MRSKIKQVFGKEKNILIGMIHLPPLLPLPGFPGMLQSIGKALADLKALQKAGFDGALIQNDQDKPHTEFATSGQVASFTVIASKVCEKARIPIGVQVMLNDWRSSFEIAIIAGAAFIRLDVFVDDVTCEWGEIRPIPAKILAYNNGIYPNLLLLTDIQLKKKTMIRPRPLPTSAALAIDNGSDGLVVTAVAGDTETLAEKLRRKKDSARFPIFVGSGVNADNVRELLKNVNGAFVGTSIKTGDRVDVRKAVELVKRLGQSRQS